MHRFLIAAAFALAACQAATEKVAPAPEISAEAPYIVAAVSDARRPATDVERDANRHPAETLAFAGVAPGDRVGELIPGGGYFTRLFAVAIGPEGRLYPVLRPEATVSEWETEVIPVAAEYPNVGIVRADFNTMTFPEPLDIVFTALNYHDLYISEYALGDAARINAAAFAALRPGGVYIVIDHAAANGAPTAEAVLLHRIDQANVVAEVEAAGFVFEAEAQFLRNSADARTASVFDEAIRGRTDQFVLRFRKPD